MGTDKKKTEAPGRTPGQAEGERIPMSTYPLSGVTPGSAEGERDDDEPRKPQK